MSANDGSAATDLTQSQIALGNEAPRVTHLLANPKGTVTGSCIAVRIGERILIATAAHVVKTTSDLRLILKKEDSILGNIAFRSCQVDESADIACLELGESESARIRESSIGLGNLMVPPNDDERAIFVMGFAGDNMAPETEIRVNESVQVREMSYMGHTFFSSTIPSDEWPVGLDHPLCGFDMFIRYSPRDQVIRARLDGSNRIDGVQDGPIPAMRGMSGGGIWLDASDREHCGRLRLIGIQVSWRLSKSWLRGTSIKAWLNLVETRFPELRGEIEAATREGKPLEEVGKSTRLAKRP